MVRRRSILPCALIESGEFSDKPGTGGTDCLQMEKTLYPTAAQFNGVYGAEFVATVASDTSSLIYAVAFASGVDGTRLYRTAVIAF